MPKIKIAYGIKEVKELKHMGIPITVIVTLTLTALNITNLWNTKQIANVLKEEDAYVEQKEIEKVDLLKAESIYDYVIGYLSSTNPQLITNEIPSFAQLTMQYAREFKINPYQCMSICQIENGFDLHKVGSRGEQGPAQLMPDTWKLYYKQFGYRIEDFYKWKCNYRVAMAHFAELLRQNNNVAAAIGEYNGGGQWANIESSRNYVQRFKLANRGISRLKGTAEKQ
jgi:soluble lytic murein transglycosylase-like protein